MIRGAVAAFLLSLATPANAEITPRAGDGDPHLQSVVYDAGEVVGLHVAAGYAVTVQFAPDERIETVTLGDSNGWAVQTSRRADRLVVKPAGVPAPTNLTVFTDQRIYNFTLYGTPPGYGVQPYLVGFTYPAAAQATTASANIVPGSYRLSGVKALWPLAVADDGHFTTIRWPDDAPLPAIYSENRRGGRVLVNGVMRDGSFVVEGVFSRLDFVLGRERAGATRLGGKP